jgi:hypothetical protein
MKPLAGLAVLALLCASVPARAQDLKSLKEKYAKGGQKAPAAPEPGPEAVPNPAELTIADIENHILQSPDCMKNSDETAEIAPALKGKYGLVACHDVYNGWSQILLVPKTPANPSRQLQYASVPGYKLLRARIADHYLVLVFDKQTQYLDLLKEEKAGAGFGLAGIVADGELTRFEDMAAFKDALKTYGDVKADSDLMAKIEGLASKAVGKRPHRLSARKINGSWFVYALSEGEFFQVWPEKKAP